MSIIRNNIYASLRKYAIEIYSYRWLYLISIIIIIIIFSVNLFFVCLIAVMSLLELCSCRTITFDDGYRDVMTRRQDDDEDEPGLWGRRRRQNAPFENGFWGRAIKEDKRKRDSTRTRNHYLFTKFAATLFSLNQQMNELFHNRNFPQVTKELLNKRQEDDAEGLWGR